MRSRFWTPDATTVCSTTASTTMCAKARHTRAMAHTHWVIAPRPLQRERYLRSTRPHKEDVRRLNTTQLATNTGATIAAKQRRANSPSMSWYLPTNSNPINQTLVSANLLSAQDEAPFL